MRTLDQIIAEQRSPEELERLLYRACLTAARAMGDGIKQMSCLDYDSIPAPPDAPGEEAAARRDRT